MRFEAIPVVDLAGGQVVHARRGERERYAPIESPLVRGARPADVVAALLALHPFRTLYIADLDAIRGRGSHAETIAALKLAHPQLALWIDAGASDAQALRRVGALGTVVVGTESLPDRARWPALSRLGLPLVLSLDHRGEQFLGPPELRLDAPSWPHRIIAMNLAQVGSAAGPDLALVQALRARRPDAAVYAAGGVRSEEDLLALRTAGAAGALIATSLHDGRIGAEVLSRL